jgi:hypothetical protein
MIENAKDRLAFIEQQMAVMRQDFKQAMAETGQLFQKMIAMNRTYQQFVEERLLDVEKRLGIIPASVVVTGGTPSSDGEEDLGAPTPPREGKDL